VLRGLVEEGLIIVGRGRITIIDVDAVAPRDT
jgi:hypothetical protein